MIASLAFPYQAETADGLGVLVRVVANIHSNDGGTLDVWASVESVEAQEYVAIPDKPGPEYIYPGDSIMALLSRRGLHQLEWIVEETYRHEQGRLVGTGCSDAYRQSPEQGR